MDVPKAYGGEIFHGGGSGGSAKPGILLDGLLPQFSDAHEPWSSALRSSAALFCSTYIPLLPF